MEKQKSFSVKPIKFLVSSFTITFSIIFVIFCFTWVFKSPASVHLGPQNLGVQSSKDFSNTSSDDMLKNSILMEKNYAGGDNSSSSQAAAHVAESEGSLLIANSSSTPFGNDNLFVGGVNVSNSSKPTVDESVEVVDVDEKVEELNGVVVEGVSSEREVRTASDEKEDSSIRSSVVDEGKNKVDCDVTRGHWVFDESYPLYTNVTCPFIDEGFSCESNGRLDKDFMKWRWQPKDCDIPRFNASKMLELIRGKRLVFVGDSLNRNQWESMLCLLMRGVKDPRKVYEARGRKITKDRGNYCFKFEEYKCTVEFYVSHYLVHESKARIGKKKGQTLRIDAIDKGSSRWRGADVLVFNTAHWWNHQKTKAGINYYQEGNQVYPRLDVTTAFKRALLTWASWADKNINPHKTRIFFRSSAPAHFSGGQWDTGGHCREAFRPLNETFTSVYPEKNLIMEEVLRKMKTPVTFLNITRLSDYRPDAHPSIYGRKAINRGVQDCSHWCLPGVPDIWNELLYYHLQSRRKAIL
ncbi:protein trichome birefringence-like 6 [Salvia miltiorrhiza]|uniref:protein trichome birefringence-like 6 n=1 Tax=Salvia miltiorrhiza TaxID=226208 RepID=UPI0025AB836A|nr:protein trichome birefringence-like 6 [Salvia miltiorrhiza]